MSAIISTPSHHPASADPAVPPCSRLGPEGAFPAELTGLSLMELQVLHSKVCRQLDHDYCTDPAGPHGCTLDRLQELLVELDLRDAA